MKKNALNNGFCQIVLAVALSFGTAFPIAAQATADTGFCTFTPTAVTSLILEHSFNLMDLQSTLQGSIPPDVINQIISGQKELRDRIMYDAAANTYRNIVFLATPGSALPTPSTFDFEPATIAFIDVAIEKVYISCQPYASVTMVGRILRGVPVFGDPKGAPTMLSFGYNTATTNPARLFRDVIAASAGLANLYHDFGAGSITLASWPGDLPVFYR